jgi:hypothetical protein
MAAACAPSYDKRPRRPPCRFAGDLGFGNDAGSADRGCGVGAGCEGLHVLGSQRVPADRPIAAVHLFQHAPGHPKVTPRMFSPSIDTIASVSFCTISRRCGPEKTPSITFTLISGMPYAPFPFSCAAPVCAYCCQPALSHSRMAATAARMASIAAAGWDTTDTCDPATSVIVEPARSAMLLGCAIGSPRALATRRRGLLRDPVVAAFLERQLELDVRGAKRLVPFPVYLHGGGKRPGERLLGLP